MVSGLCGVTVHHVRRHGEPKNDRRTVPLLAHYHLIGIGGKDSIEYLGKQKFEEKYGVDLEASIVKLNEQYEKEKG